MEDNENFVILRDEETDLDKKDDDNVIPLRAKDPQEELERLNRLTGLAFEHMPASLIGEEGGLELAVDDGAELIHRALYLWSEPPQ
jgi:hypothetical protein